MEHIVTNPYLPLGEYIPDGEPHVFDGRLYVFGSHDMEGGDRFCPLDYVSWSAPVNNLSQWTCHGTLYRKTQDKNNPEGSLPMNAPDVVRGNDGRYYLYYCIGLRPRFSVAVSSQPEGPYRYWGEVHSPDSTPFEEGMPFDPAVINDDGTIRMYYGFSPPFPIHGKFTAPSEGCMHIMLADDMLTVISRPTMVIPARQNASGTDFANHAYFEAPSIRKLGGLYYLVYCSENSDELCYALSSRPDSGFMYAGVIISNGDIGLHGRAAENAVWPTGNNHGGLAEINGKLYIFYHRHTHGSMFSRQGCAELLSRNSNGYIPQTEMTSQGLYGKPLPAKGAYPAAIACNLWHGAGAKAAVFDTAALDEPRLTSTGNERFLTMLDANTIIGYKYFMFTGRVQLELTCRATQNSVVEASLSPYGKALARINIPKTKRWINVFAALSAQGTHALYLRCSQGQFDLKTLAFHI